jgi:vacuolar-type H+-ATPase subunit C/Vma6
MRLPAAADFNYGNTRLRARRSELLDASDYQRLLDLDLDALLDTLQRRYRSEPTGAHPNDPRQSLHEVIAGNLGRSLEDMRSFYRGRARELVDLLLSRFDVANLITVLRARARPHVRIEEAHAALIPVGWLNQPTAHQAVRPTELAVVVELLAKALPDRDQAMALHRSFAQYERTHDLASLERAVIGDHATRTLARLRRLGRAGTTLLRAIQREADENNIIVTLRLRDAIMSGADDTPPPQETLLPGGSIPSRAFAAALREPDPTAISATLGRQYGKQLHSALEAWAATGDVSALQRTLQRNAIADATALFLTGDPLGIGIPLAFTTVTEAEAQNLRLLAEAAARGIPAQVVRHELLWPAVPR